MQHQDINNQEKQPQILTSEKIPMHPLITCELLPGEETRDRRNEKQWHQKRGNDRPETYQARTGAIDGVRRPGESGGDPGLEN